MDFTDYSFFNARPGPAQSVNVRRTMGSEQAYRSRVVRHCRITRVAEWVYNSVVAYALSCFHLRLVTLVLH